MRARAGLPGRLLPLVIGLTSSPRGRAGDLPGMMIGGSVMNQRARVLSGRRTFVLDLVISVFIDTQAC